MPTAPPQWASASHENGFSYLSWKRKTFLAAVVVGCGFGLAALFPNNTASGDLAAVPKNSAQTEQADSNAEASPVFSQPQNRYANNVHAAKEGDKPSFIEPNERVERYTPPPVMSKENEPKDSPPAPHSPALQSTRKFESIDYTGFERTALDLPLARWNPLFDKPPPLSERSLQPLIDDSALVPAQGEMVQTMKVTPEPLITTIIDSAFLVPAEEYEHEITILIQENSIVPADQDFP